MAEVKNGPFEGDPAVMFFISLVSFFLLCCLFELFSSFFGFLSNVFDCWHKCQSLTLDVSSAVSAPWRCGVLTT